MRLPSFFTAAENASTAGQRRYLWAIRLRLGALVVAAVGGAIPTFANGSDPFAWVALSGFAAAVLVEVYVFADAPDRLWYEGRAAAESIKTLSWRFAVGGTPFPAVIGPVEATSALRRRLVDVASDLQHADIPPTPTGADLVPPDLLVIRAAPFAERRDAYSRGRIDEQRDWYSKKAREHGRRSRQFLVATLVLEFAGILAATLRASHVVTIDLLGIAAAVVAGVAAWSQTRQYASLSSAYSIAARELGVAADELRTCTESDWSDFVGRVEEAISREHTLWRSTRGAADGRIRQ